MIEALKQLVEELNERWRIASLKHINQANIHALGEAHAYDYIASRLRKIIQRGGWISVEKRLPEPGVPVLVYVPETADEYAYYTIDVIDPDSDGDIWIKHYEHYEWAESVAFPGATGVPKEKAPYTHWQPLPDPPEKEASVK